MKTRILCFLAAIALHASLFVPAAKADEGMWVMGCMSQRADSILHSLGLELTADQLYSSEHPSQNDVVVQLGGFCSGVVVSDQGLMFTNHHCGFGSIHEHSTTKHDYLKYGFVAQSFKEELPNEDLYVLFHLSTTDVTDRILGAIPAGATKEERDSIMNAVANEIINEVDDESKGIFGEVDAFYSGSRYCLSVYQRYDDVRLVYAPPQCLGKFGGETDNWIWPRQTCDFSVFRIYADKNGNPAPYSKSNVPLRPKNFAHVSTQGYQPGSFAMTLGYPGSTDRYLSSFGIENRMRQLNQPRYDCRTALQDVLLEAMHQSDELRIKYADKYVSSANYWKNSLGMNHALEKLDVLGEKRALEHQLTHWIASDSTAHAPYIGILDSLEAAYAANASATYARIHIIECLLTASDIMNVTFRTAIRQKLGGKNAMAKLVDDSYKNIDLNVDKRLFATMLKYFLTHVTDSQYHPQFVTNTIEKEYNGDIDRFVDELYTKSIYSQPSRLRKVKKTSKLFEDPMSAVAMDIYALLIGMETKPVDEYERLLGDAIREMNNDREYYPDANFTMRISGGTCQPIDYDPLPAGQVVATDWRDPNFSCQDLEEAREYVTTPKSLINKNNNQPDNEDYELIPSVKKWINAGEFDKRFVDPKTGTLPLCFLTTNDITGGNSGSGVYDGKGRLIGLAFDGNWEAMSGDIKFNDKLQRCINVDIRYVLSVIGDYGKAKRLIDELVIE